MSGIGFSSPVTNQKASPAVYAAPFAQRPAAQLPGRIFIDTDNPSTGIYRDTGTAWVQIAANGGGALTLQDVTDNGNTTTDNILLTYEDSSVSNALVYYNNTLTQEEYIIEKKAYGISLGDVLSIQSKGNISPSTDPVGIIIDGGQNTIKTFYGTSYQEIGLKLDLINNQLSLGDFAQTSDGTSFIVEMTNNVIKTSYQNNDIGLKLDFANNYYLFGDEINTNNFLRINNISNGTAELCSDQVGLGDIFSFSNGVLIQISNYDSNIFTQYGGNDIGLKLDFANETYTFGKSGVVSLECLANNSVFQLSDQYGPNGLQVDFNSTTNVYLGDFSGNYNGTSLIINDTNQRLELSGNLASGTAGGSSGQHLKIRVGGTDYKIALLNP